MVSFSPIHHWTEPKDQGPQLYCALAQQIAHLMRRHAPQAGPNLSIRGLLTALASIEETVLLL